MIGGIWRGIFTPTEAAGFGALGALLIGVIKGMRWADILDAILQATRTTAPIMFLLITARCIRAAGAGRVRSTTHPGMFFGLGVDPWMIRADDVIWIDAWGC